jgi:hypothetical protein
MRTIARTRPTESRPTIGDQVLTIYMAARPSAVILNKDIQGFNWGGFAGNPLISLADMKRSQ